MKNLKNWAEGTDLVLLKGTDQIPVNEVSYDSRIAAPGCVFVCMQGSRFDSHDCIPELYEKGIRAFVVEKDLSELSLPEDDSVTVMKTKDVRTTLALLSAARFDHPEKELKIIGITGTKGKTTSSTMLRTVLEEAGVKTGLIGTNGCFIAGERTATRNTTPESYELFFDFRKMADAGCGICVMEVSSQAVKMKRTAGITFDIGVFLNISPDHIGPDEHESFEEYLDCKAGVLRQAKTVVINKETEHLSELLQRIGSHEKTVFFSASGDADERAENIRFISEEGFFGSEFDAAGLMNCTVRVPLPGKYNISNTLSVITVASLLKIDAGSVVKGIRATSVDGRSEVVAATDRFSVLVDYAHNEVSMESLLAAIREDYHPKRLVVVFGCGGNRSKDRRTGMGTVAAKKADFTVITSDNPRYEKPEDILKDIEDAYLKAGGESYVLIPDRREAIRWSMEHAEPGDLIAVIGKGHEDYQEICGVRNHFLDKEVILEEKEKLGLK